MKKFGILLEQKRKDARLSISELAGLVGLTESGLEALERGAGDVPNFDTCYRIGLVIAERSGQKFVLNDLWQALRSDLVESNPANQLFVPR
jgi:transcriptional regulator with XRE-family HTH domain